MKMDDYYNSHKITLRLGHQDAGKWICQYVVVKFGYADMGKRSGYAEGAFSSRKNAEAAALAKTKALIDSSWPPRPIDFELSGGVRFISRIPGEIERGHDHNKKEAITPNTNNKA
jgi:hypothetical protein